MLYRSFEWLPLCRRSLAVGKQVLRSGTSVGANYREAYRGRSRAEFTARMGDCLKELEETAYWLELFVEGSVAEEKQLAALHGECKELAAIFVTIIKNTKKQS